MYGLALLPAFYAFALALPSPQATDTFAAGNSSVGLPLNDIIDCVPADKEQNAFTWECISALQSMPRDPQVHTFNRATKQLPRDFVVGKCQVIIDFKDERINTASESWLSLQAAGTQILQACLRTGNSPQVLPRGGGKLMIGPDYKMFIMVSKPLKGYQSSKDLTPSYIQQVKAGLSGGIQQSLLASPDDDTSDSSSSTSAGIKPVYSLSASSIQTS